MKLRLTIISILTLILADQSRCQVKAIRNHYKQAQKDQFPYTAQFLKPDDNVVDNYGSLQQIMLMRHGEPALYKKGWVKRQGAEGFVIAYDTVGIYDPEFTPAELGSEEVPVIQTSSLNRARDTALKVFGEDRKFQPDTLFREFERKMCKCPNLKLPLKQWLITSRVLWLMGMNKKGIESYKQAKKRSDRAAARLEGIANENDRAVLVAHGFLNKHVIKKLKKRGWSVALDGGSDYLATYILVRFDPPDR